MDAKRVKTVYTQESLREALDRDGYVVVPNVLDDPERLASLFWDYMEGLTMGRVRRDSKESLTQANRPVHTRGLLQHYNCGLQRYAIETRMAVKPVFEALWGTDKLTSSFDGTSFTWQRKTYTHKDLRAWRKDAWNEKLHIDQTEYGFSSVQGGVALTRQRENEHVFVCVPGSHRYHEQLLEISVRAALSDWSKVSDSVKKALHRDGVTEYHIMGWDAMTAEAKDKVMKIGLKMKTLHWEVMSDNQKTFLREKCDLKVVRVPLEAGDMVLWDSRTVHTSATYTKDSDQNACRIQVFVAMKPAVNTPEEIEKRAKAFEAGRVSKHSADYIRLFPKQPHTHGSNPAPCEIPPSDPNMTDEEKRLHGLIPYE
jgi:ectoine hydroxylase-related dioxygenase (phytanoyl-CoA dioxygenase family)